MVDTRSRTTNAVVATLCSAMQPNTVTGGQGLPLEESKTDGTASKMTLRHYAKDSKHVSAQVESLQLLDEKKSFDLVRTLMCTTIANIMFYRGLLPTECISTKLYDIDNPHLSYKDLLDVQYDEVTLEALKRKHRSQPTIKLLQRGVDERSDKLLRWLDAVAEAIQKRYLATMQIGIYENKITQEGQVEVYGLSVSYNDNAPTVDLNVQTKACGTLMSASSKDAKFELTKVVADLVKSFRDKPSLLDARLFLDIKLTYNSAAPSGYQPPGFKENTGNDVVIPMNQMLSVGLLDSIYHRAIVSSFVRYTVQPDGQTRISALYEDHEIISPTRNQALAGLKVSRKEPCSAAPLTQDPATTHLYFQTLGDETSSGLVYARIKRPLPGIQTKKLPRNPVVYHGETSSLEMREKQEAAELRRYGYLRSDNHNLDDTQFLSSGFASPTQFDAKQNKVTASGSSTQGTPSQATPRGRGSINGKQIDSNSTVDCEGTQTLCSHQRPSTPQTGRHRIRASLLGKRKLLDCKEVDYKKAKPGAASPIEVVGLDCSRHR